MQLDVTDQGSVDAAARTVEQAGGLDVLVNNAGIVDGLDIPFEKTDVAAMAAILDTNVLGPMRATLGLWPLLQASPAPVIVNVSSSLGSLGIATDREQPQYAYAPVAYPASKAALNMLTVKLAYAFPRAHVVAVNPGFTATALNDHTGTRTVEDGATVIVEAAQGRTGHPNGSFVEDAGVVPW